MESSRWEKDANLAPFVDQVLDAGQQTANFVTTKGLMSRVAAAPTRMDYAWIGEKL